MSTVRTSTVAMAMAAYLSLFAFNTSVSQQVPINPKPTRCAGVPFEPPDFVKKADDACKGEIPNNDGMQFACLEACRFKKVGLIVDESKPVFDITKVDSIYSQIPNPPRDALIVDVKKCIQSASSGGPLNSTNFCMSHMPYLMCLRKASATHCRKSGTDIGK